MTAPPYSSPGQSQIQGGTVGQLPVPAAGPAQPFSSGAGSQRIHLAQWCAYTQGVNCGACQSSVEHAQSLGVPDRITPVLGAGCITAAGGLPAIRCSRSRIASPAERCEHDHWPIVSRRSSIGPGHVGCGWGVRIPAAMPCSRSAGGTFSLTDIPTRRSSAPSRSVTTLTMPATTKTRAALVAEGAHIVVVSTPLTLSLLPGRRISRPVGELAHEIRIRPLPDSSVRKLTARRGIPTTRRTRITAHLGKRTNGVAGLATASGPGSVGSG
jgi:hypothetical protein